MTIIVYGPGCARCHETERVVRNVLTELQCEADLQTIGDYPAMVAAGVMATPAVSVNGVIKVSGRVPKADEIKTWLR